MNATLGIVLLKADREVKLSPLSPRFRTWGSEVVEEEGPQRFSFDEMPSAEFVLFPVTKFVRGKLPARVQTEELEYASIRGPGLDSYVSWAEINRDASSAHPFEAGLRALLSELEFWALIFAPEGERLGGISSTVADSAVRMLREGTSDLSLCTGFLVVKA